MKSIDECVNFLPFMNVISNLYFAHYLYLCLKIPEKNVKILCIGIMHESDLNFSLWLVIFCNSLYEMGINVIKNSFDWIE